MVRGMCLPYFTRIPYASLTATIMCFLGVAVFCGTMYRGATLAFTMFDIVFKMRLFWVQPMQITFVIIGVCMSALGCMILVVGYLTTGQTRHTVYTGWRSWVGGRITCAVFLAITYMLEIVWILTFCFHVIVTFIFTIFWYMCHNPRIQLRKNCIDLTQFYFFFPSQHKQEHMKVCSDQEVKRFCEDYVGKVEVLFILATSSCLLIIISLVHYLMCLSANYAHIRNHKKFQKLQELRYLADMERIRRNHRY